MKIILKKMATPVDVVALNVGGTLFNTTLATLTKVCKKIVEILI